VLRNTLENGALGSLRSPGHATRSTPQHAATLRPQETSAPTVTRVGSPATGAVEDQRSPIRPEPVDAQPVLGTTERWILRNAAAGSTSTSRRGPAADLAQRPAADSGRADQGSPGTSVARYRVKMKFTDHTGRYVFLPSWARGRRDDGRSGRGTPPRRPRPQERHRSRSLVPAYAVPIPNRSTGRSWRSVVWPAGPVGPPDGRPPDANAAGRASAGSGFRAWPAIRHPADRPIACGMSTCVAATLATTRVNMARVMRRRIITAATPR
jgi:hypothetical protein